MTETDVMVFVVAGFVVLLIGALACVGIFAEVFRIRELLQARELRDVGVLRETEAERRRREARGIVGYGEGRKTAQ